MKVHPFLVAGVAALVAVSAFGARLVVRQRAARARRLAPRVVDEPPPLVLRRPLVVPMPPVVQEEARPAPAPAPGGTLRVRVVGPHGLLLPTATVTAVRVGSDDDEVVLEAPTDDDDETDAAPDVRVATDLPMGRYLVTATAPGMRTGAARDVGLDGEVLTIALDRAPRLSGAVGELPGGCAGARIRVRAPADGGGIDGSVNEDCTFSIDDLPEGDPLAVDLFVGRGREPVARALVSVPVTGDPALVCLAPPCAPAPSPAAVVVYVADAAGRLVDDAEIEWTLEEEWRGEMMGMSTGAGVSYVSGRQPGETLDIGATVNGRHVATKIVVGAGVNDVVLTP
ncbi:MAG TPA: hypothetical protein VHJ20_00510 [Polyangia bacterium]|nr:hypothetical protein [Polyangia bacterium]